MNFHIYRNSKDTQGICVSLNAILSRIKSGAKELDAKTEVANSLAKGDSDAYRDYKATLLPAVIFSASMDGQGRTQNHVVGHTGLIVVDFDNVSDMGSTLAELHVDSHLLLAYVSPSGRGIKAVFPITPIPEISQHKQAYRQVIDYCRETYTEADTSGSDINRCAFLAHDPLLIHNPNAIPIEIDLTEVKPVSKPIRYTGDVDISILDHINPDTLDYEDWLRVGFACKTAGLPCEVWDAWSRRGSRYQEQECEKRWNGFTRDTVTWSTVVYLAMQNGYQPQSQNGSNSLHRRIHKPIHKPIHRRIS